MINKEDIEEIIVCRKEDDVVEVSRILRDTMSRHLVVVDEKDSPVGIISTVDINNRVVAEEKDPKTTKAKDIMTKDIAVATINDKPEVAFEKMQSKNTFSIPVVNEKKKLIGMIHLNKLLKYLSQEEIKEFEEK